jgi:hypothetical protein
MKTLLIKTILLLLFFILLLGSCTVQKRLYISGYHVNWHLNKPAVTSIKIKNDLVVTPRRIKVEGIISTPISNELNIVLLEEKVKPLSFKINQTILQESSYVNNKKQSPSMKVIVVKESEQLQDLEMKQPTVNQTKTSPRKGVLSTIFSILTWGFIFIGITMIFSSGVMLGWIILALAVVTLLASFTLGISALYKPKDNTDLIFGIIGTIISVVSILLIIGSVF